MRLVAWVLGALAVVLIAFVVLREAGLPFFTTFGFDTSGILAPDCTRKVSLDAELHVTQESIWATDRKSGLRIDLRLDDSLALSPTSEIVDASTSRVVARNGDPIVSGCYDLVQNAYQIGVSDISLGP